MNEQAKILLMSAIVSLQQVEKMILDGSVYIDRANIRSIISNIENILQ